MSDLAKKSLTREQKKEIIKLIFTGILALAAVAAVIFTLVFYFSSNNQNSESENSRENITGLADITLSSKLTAVPYGQFFGYDTFL